MLFPCPKRMARYGCAWTTEIYRLPFLFTHLFYGRSFMGNHCRRESLEKTRLFEARGEGERFNSTGVLADSRTTFHTGPLPLHQNGTGVDLLDFWGPIRRGPRARRRVHPHRLRSIWTGWGPILVACGAFTTLLPRLWSQDNFKSLSCRLAIVPAQNKG